MQFLNIILFLNTLNPKLLQSTLFAALPELVYSNHPILNISPYKFPKSQMLIITPLKDLRDASLGVSFPSCNSLIFAAKQF